MSKVNERKEMPTKLQKRKAKNKFMIRFSASIAIREINIKSIMRLLSYPSEVQN